MLPAHTEISSESRTDLNAYKPNLVGAPPGNEYAFQITVSGRGSDQVWKLAGSVQNLERAYLTRGESHAIKVILQSAAWSNISQLEWFGHSHLCSASLNYLVAVWGMLDQKNIVHGKESKWICNGHTTRWMDTVLSSKWAENFPSFAIASHPHPKYKQSAVETFSTSQEITCIFPSLQG